MAYKYAVWGAGRQGTAAAYDLIKFGEAEWVLLADYSLAAAEAAARRVNELLDSDKARAMQLDALEPDERVAVLAGVDVLVSALPYYVNPDVTRLALELGFSMCDLGGNTDIVREQLALDAEARAAGIRVIPDCGQVPGMGTTLIVHALAQLDEAEEVFMWDGGLPQNPRPPFNYLATFSIEGLSNEYGEPAVYLRDGVPAVVPPLTELEEVEFPPPIGRVEAFTTSGGLSTLPWTYEGKLKTIQNKTIRYPGHFAQLRAYADLGLFEEGSIFVAGDFTTPRMVFEVLFEERVTFPGDRDVCAIRIRAVGRKDGRPAEAVVEMIDFYDEATGFTAMERTTGWDAAIVAAMMARGQTPLGAVPVERAVPPDLFLEELGKRGIEVQTRVSFL